MSGAPDNRPLPDGGGAPTVSVVVPCYNSHAFLDQTLESIRAQTFGEVEIVVVDDGSNDPETLSALARLGADVRLVRQPNKGLPAARNAGIAAATGAFIVPLDADDWLAPRAIEAMVAALQASPGAAFTFCDMTMEGELRGVLIKNFNAFEQLFFNQLPYCLCYRKASWVACGGYDEAMRRGYEDWDFNIRLAQTGPGVRVPEPLFHYRIARGGMLMGLSNKIHVELWNAIRRKHGDLYRLGRLVALWRVWRKLPSSYPLAGYFVWMALVDAVPLTVSTRLFAMLRKMSQSRRVALRS
jgi:glycosyltransferase involved in cell wall biosynthesis